MLLGLSLKMSKSLQVTQFELLERTKCKKIF
jgi:hypothetical protein